MKNKLFVIWYLFLSIALLIHFSITILYNSPVNPITYKYYPAIQSYMQPLFNQNWKLFAPDPVSNNHKLLVKGYYKGENGKENETQWIDVTELLVTELHKNRLTPLRLAVAQITTSTIETVNKYATDQMKAEASVTEDNTQKGISDNDRPSYEELINHAINGDGAYPRELIVLRGASSNALYKTFGRHFDEIIIRINIERFPDYYDYIMEEDVEIETIYIQIPKIPYKEISEL
ncbi:DUF5819 family protein [Sporosarcina sp. UB5]|uniref:DUF5819 family protein n=1 Tax=Sporosarcina sp. UB5 TaxID=3047463 RepID=UPI003D792A26